MDKIILIGGGGHCNSVIDVIETEGRFKIVGIIDRFQSIGAEILGYKVIGNDDDDLRYLLDVARYALITVGQIQSADLKARLFYTVKKQGFIFPVVISPRAYVSRHSSIDEGTIVMHNAVINSGVSVGRNCIINTKGLVEHDCKVGDNCHISTGSIINGGCKIGDGCFIGSNAVTREYVDIPSNSFVKAGSLVK